ncbi:GGDEF domain-containing protein [Anaerocolumna chitinilytica]|uniref:GGDEF domain-containing protein n=1 Tax=Anaerocolumna chitinilytica TaxID=1727145 RepID=A0A7I8DKT3_9FIRM|nr:diguanylate cyclase [Anaerocolumna chitinilytica]BCJ99043.1 hypothetical protein bsdcttw_20840 [Anaerocolumna chitinilytica]
MEWIKEGLKLLISRSDKEQLEFEKYNSLLVLRRIRLISLATIFLSVFWACMDWIIIDKGADRIYTTTLIVMHTISEVASAAFLIFYRRITANAKKNYRTIIIVIKVYVFLYILFGALSSINSQRYTGNIYSYIILLLITAIAFTLKPSFMIWAFGVNHIVFFIGLSILCKDTGQFLTKMVNATIFTGAAFLLCFIFYRNRMLEFFYRKQLKENEKELSNYAFIDSLTGILNRRMGSKKLEDLFKEAQKTSMEFVLCYLDINDLKYVNDTYGHNEGDRYILTFCDIIKDVLKEEDIFFRMGGDEFIVVFKDRNKEQVENIWNGLVKKIHEKNAHGELPYQIVVSHGLIYYRTGMDCSLEEMIEKADILMYKEKQILKKNINT